jgi:hypothetical protein
MPWDQPASPPAQPYQPPAQPYQPPPAPRPAPPPQTVTARNQQTGETVKLDLGSVIQQAVNDALRQNSAAAAQKASTAMAAKAIPRAAMPKGSTELTGDETVEEAFTSGAVTRLTFLRGIALDIGVALAAAFATIASGPNFSAFDAELWTAIVPALVMKTVVQTGMSFVLKAKYTE